MNVRRITATLMLVLLLAAVGTPALGAPATSHEKADPGLIETAVQIVFGWFEKEETLDEDESGDEGPLVENQSGVFIIPSG